MVSVLVTEAVEEDEEESHGLHLLFVVQFAAGTCLELPEKNLKKKEDRKIERIGRELINIIEERI